MELFFSTYNKRQTLTFVATCIFIYIYILLESSTFVCGVQNSIRVNMFILVMIDDINAFSSIRRSGTYIASKHCT